MDQDGKKGREENRFAEDAGFNVDGGHDGDMNSVFLLEILVVCFRIINK